MWAIDGLCAQIKAKKTVRKKPQHVYMLLQYRNKVRPFPYHKKKRENVKMKGKYEREI